MQVGGCCKWSHSFINKKWNMDYFARILQHIKLDSERINSSLYVPLSMVGFHLLLLFFPLTNKTYQEEKKIEWKRISFHLTNVLSVTDYSDSYENTQCSNERKISLPFYQVNKFWRKQWACVSANTQNFTLAVKGKQRKWQLVADVGERQLARRSSVSALWVQEICVGLVHHRLVSIQWFRVTLPRRRCLVFAV